MKLLVLNGNSDPTNNNFDRRLTELTEKLQDIGHDVELIDTKDLNIISCTGCWSCWVKTPGECAFKDDTVKIRSDYIHSDLVIFASPLITGFVTARLKKIMDKLIPLLHPYIEIVDREFHHAGRYDKYPPIGLLVENPGGDSEDEEITSDIFKRFAVNFRTHLAFSQNFKNDTNTIIDEIIHH